MTKRKTAHEIRRDVRRLLIDSPLAAELTGSVYYEDCRPRDSKKEDAVVIFTTATADEVQEGVITINIFFADIDPWSDGVFVEDGERAETLETLAEAWAESLTADKTDGYLFRLQQTIQTLPDQEKHEHFVVIKLSFKHLD